MRPEPVIRVGSFAADGQVSEADGMSADEAQELNAYCTEVAHARPTPRACWRRCAAI